MNYKVLIKPCSDPKRAQRIAEEIARWSGSPVDIVKNALSQKQICIQKEASEIDAFRLKKQFEAVGAEIELVSLQAVSSSTTAETKQSRLVEFDDDEEEEEVFGRTLTDAEYAKVLSSRPDIFIINSDNTLRNLEVIFLILGFITGIWFSNYKMPEGIDTDYVDKVKKEERTASLAQEVDKNLIDSKEKKPEEKIEEKKDDKNDIKKLKQSKIKAGNGGRSGGGGDPRARVTQKGVLGIISGKVKGKSIAGADVFGKGGFASSIDAVIAGTGGLKSGGGGGVGRKGVAGIGFGTGYGSGFGGGGGGSGGIDDLIGGLGEGGSSSALTLKTRGKLDISAPPILTGGALTGGRSKQSIMRVVEQNLGALRYAYNKRLREKPGLAGKIKIKFAIDEFGKVVICDILESTMSDPALEAEVVAKIKRWVFDKIDKPGDITEVVYPFKFTP